MSDITLMKNRVLNRAIPARVKFNPRSKKHRESLKVFLETGRWGDVLFVPEHPHVEVPMTVLMKLAEHNLGIEQKEAA